MKLTPEELAEMNRLTDHAPAPVRGLTPKELAEMNKVSADHAQTQGPSPEELAEMNK
jgi:hypothetical protein